MFYEIHVNLLFVFYEVGTIKIVSLGALATICFQDGMSKITISSTTVHTTKTELVSNYMLIRCHSLLYQNDFYLNITSKY